MALTPNLSRYDARLLRRLRGSLAVVTTGLALLLGLQVAAAVWLARGDAAGGRAGSPLAQDLAEREARLAEAPAPVRPDERQALAARIAFLNRLLEARAFSWSRLLRELEEALPPRVELAEVAPDVATGRVRLQGVASTTETLSGFTARLAARPTFAEVTLLQQVERAARPGGRDGGIEFQVALRYRGER